MLRTHERQGPGVAATSGSLDKGKCLARLAAPDRNMALNGASVVPNYVTLLPLQDQMTMELHLVV